MNTIITMHELHGLTDQELGELHQLLTLLLAEADTASQERRNILASLKSIRSLLGYPRSPRVSPCSIRQPNATGHLARRKKNQSWLP